MSTFDVGQAMIILEEYFKELPKEKHEQVLGSWEVLRRNVYPSDETVQYTPPGYKHLEKMQYDFLGNVGEDRCRVKVIANKAFTIRSVDENNGVVVSGTFVKNDPALIGAEFIMNKKLVFG